MSTAFHIAAALVSLFLIKNLYHRLFNQGPKAYVPYDLIGIVFPVQVFINFRRQTLLPYIQQLLRAYGGTFVANILTQDYVFTHDAQNIQHMLKSQFESFSAASDRTHLFQHLSTRGVLTLDGAPWRVAREQLRQQFFQQRAMVDLDMHERHIHNLIVKLESSESVVVNLKDYFVSLVQDSHSEFVLGASVDSLALCQSAEQKSFSNEIIYATDMLAKKGFAGPFHWLVGGQRFVQTCASLNRYIEKHVFRVIGQNGLIRHANTPASTYSFINGLNTTKMDPVTLRDQVTNVFVAGVDSMASTLNSAFWLLARHEKVYQKLRNEILETCHQLPLSYDQIKRLKYLRHVLNEVLRLYPPVPLDMRTAVMDTVLPCGAGPDGRSPFPIKKGQHVVFSSFSSHRQQDIFGEGCHEFQPERWDEIKSNSPGYLPFHTGPRSCPGQQYAFVVLSYTIARLVQTFPRIVSRDEREWKERISMTLDNDNEVFVSLFRS